MRKNLCYGYPFIGRLMVMEDLQRLGRSAMATFTATILGCDCYHNRIWDAHVVFC